MLKGISPYVLGMDNSGNKHSHWWMIDPLTQADDNE